MRARSSTRIRLLALASVLAVTSASPPLRAAGPDPDPWIAKDKALHFSFSAIIAGGSYAMGTAIFDARGHALIAAGGLTLAIGAGKELIDLAGYGDPSWRDFAADVAGTIVGLALGWSIDLIVRGVDGQSHPLFVAPREAASPSSVLPAPRGLVVSF